MNEPKPRKRTTTSTWERTYLLATPLEPGTYGGSLVTSDPTELGAVLAEAAADMRGLSGAKRRVTITRFSVVAEVRQITFEHREAD